MSGTCENMASKMSPWMGASPVDDISIKIKIKNECLVLCVSVFERETGMKGFI